jgi:hypothetical protein
MSSTDLPRGSIAAAPRRGQRGAGSGVAPERELLDSDRCRLFRQGQPRKADLLLFDAGPTRFIVKDFRRKPWWVRWTGRLLIARESRAYRILGRTEGLPRFAGRVDAHALAVEYVDAVPLAFAPDRTRDGADKLDQLRAIMDRLHRAGVVHGDLRGRDNVLVDRGGRVWVVDLASAFCLRPGGLGHRILFRGLRQIDQAALLKWKRIVAGGPLWLHRRKAWRGGTRPRG